MAIEDACSLSVLLPRGTPRSEIDERLALYQQVRDERPHKLQAMTRNADKTIDRESYHAEPRKFDINPPASYIGVDHQLQRLTILTCTSNTMNGVIRRELSRNILRCEM